MACGFGLAAVRELSRRMPMSVFTSTLSSSSTAPLGPRGASMTEPACSADSERAFLSTRENLDERILENEFHEGNEEDEASSDVESSVCDAKERSLRSKNFSSGEIPLLSEFLDPQTLASYIKLSFQADGESSFASGSDAEDCEDASLAEESDGEEMYSGPLQPLRTIARRDFPAPSEYLAREKLLSLVEGFHESER
eukprot:TRINITY_DN38553_c0_g1_i1.p1 TRINITY_DN38553_c0_g1~~TRINITY_DN38553_c0_g1_i1.p1  ORF type:complete len:197 (-),score=34.78 TRINITY_DN38553_c0_g1_i1:83-673(-)